MSVQSMYKDVFCFKIGMFSVKNNLGWVMNRTDNLYSCVGTFQGSLTELLITLVSFKQIYNVCFFEQLISTTLFLNKLFIILLRFPSSAVFKAPTNSYLHNSKVYPLHFASELKVRNNKHHCSSLAAYVSQLLAELA